jgi:hypothetical protein
MGQKETAPRVWGKIEASLEKFDTLKNRTPGLGENPLPEVRSAFSLPCKPMKFADDSQITILSDSHKITRSGKP